MLISCSEERVDFPDKVQEEPTCFHGEPVKRPIITNFNPNDHLVTTEKIIDGKKVIITKSRPLSTTIECEGCKIIEENLEEPKTIILDPLKKVDLKEVKKLENEGLDLTN